MKQKVALVLSGGGARGIAHIGVIEELEKRGFEISSIAGTSMGAVIAGVYTLGTIDAYKNWLYTLDKMKLFSLVDFNFNTQGLVKGDRLFQKMKDFIPDVNIENLRIPYATVATDIINKKEVVFTQGSLLDAIRASIAIPTVLTPVKTADGLLVDGGIINNIPINNIKRNPGDLLIAVNVNADIEVYKPVIAPMEVVAEEQSIYQKKLREFYSHLQKFYPAGHEERLGYFNLMNRTINLMMNQITQMSLEKHSPDLLIEISIDSCGIFDFYRAEQMVETGRTSAINSLENFTRVKKQA